MDHRLKELMFAVILIVSAGIGFTTYMLGVLLDPLPGALISLLLVGLGLLTVVPREKLPVAAILGTLGIFLAGILIPRIVPQYLGAADELTISLLLGGVILMLTVALLHVTTFARPSSHTS